MSKGFTVMFEVFFCFSFEIRVEFHGSNDDQGHCVVSLGTTLFLRGEGYEALTSPHSGV